MQPIDEKSEKDSNADRKFFSRISLNSIAVDRSIRSPSPIPPPTIYEKPFESKKIKKAGTGMEAS